MAITLPVYTNCARQNVGNPAGTAEFPAGAGGAIKIRVFGDTAAEADSPGVARSCRQMCCLRGFRFSRPLTSPSSVP